MFFFKIIQSKYIMKKINQPLRVEYKKKLLLPLRLQKQKGLSRIPRNNYYMQLQFS